MNDRKKKTQIVSTVFVNTSLFTSLTSQPFQKDTRVLASEERSSTTEKSGYAPGVGIAGISQCVVLVILNTGSLIHRPCVNFFQSSAFVMWSSRLFFGCRLVSTTMAWNFIFLKSGRGQNFTAISLGSTRRLQLFQERDSFHQATCW